MTVFIGLLNPGTNEDDISAFLKANGVSAIKVAVQRDHTTGRSRRFALLEVGAAAAVVAACNGKNLSGVQVIVKEIK